MKSSSNYILSDEFPMNLAPSPSVKQVSESNHLFDLKRTEGKHYWLCVCWAHWSNMGEYYHFSFAAWHGFGKFAFYSALVAYHITWRACFFKRSCMVIVLIKAFVYNCTIMPPIQSLVEFKAPPDLSSFPLATCWAEVQKTNSPSRLPLLSCNNRKKTFEL